MRTTLRTFGDSPSCGDSRAETPIRLLRVLRIARRSAHDARKRAREGGFSEEKKVGMLSGMEISPVTVYSRYKGRSRPRIGTGYLSERELLAATRELALFGEEIFDANFCTQRIRNGTDAVSSVRKLK